MSIPHSWPALWNRFPYPQCIWIPNCKYNYVCEFMNISKYLDSNSFSIAELCRHRFSYFKLKETSAFLVFVCKDSSFCFLLNFWESEVTDLTSKIWFFLFRLSLKLGLEEANLHFQVQVDFNSESIPPLWPPQMSSGLQMSTDSSGHIGMMRIPTSQHACTKWCCNVRANLLVSLILRMKLPKIDHWSELDSHAESTTNRGKYVVPQCKRLYVDFAIEASKEDLKLLIWEPQEAGAQLFLQLGAQVYMRSETRWGMTSQDFWHGGSAINVA